MQRALKAGQVVQLTYEENNATKLHSLCVVKQSFSWRVMLRLFKNLHPENKKAYSPQDFGFWLIELGYLQPVEPYTLHLGGKDGGQHVAPPNVKRLTHARLASLAIPPRRGRKS